MTRVSESLWRVSVNFDGQSNQRFKFDVLGDWTQNYGDNDNDGVWTSQVMTLLPALLVPMMLRSMIKHSLIP